MGKFREKDFKIENYEEFYDDHHFAPLPDEEALNAHRIFPRVIWALDIAKEVGAKRILDLGCLEGYAVLTILHHTNAESGVGVDLSAEGIALGNKRAKGFNLKAKFIKDSIEDFMSTYTGEKFDLIMAFEVMEHVKDPEEVFRLIDTVKTKDGTVLISTPDFEAPTYGKDDEQNKCHIRLYTTADDDYTGVNKYGNTRLATSLTKQVGKERFISINVYSQLIHARYV
jgi:2-polyprenyl-3-methyl-5-hydroxy-6-metoxy-1,4-benzoquinol methylase